MFTIRKAGDRGHASFGWLDSRHTFSFGSYRDPAHMGFGPLRVINEDRVVPGAGFGTHGHQDMEILSWVLEGSLEHKDSTGTGSILRPGDIQRMTAGTGIRHSEFNHSPSEPVHFLQIWIEPDRGGLAPGYEQISIEQSALQDQLRLVAGPLPGAGAVTVHQDAKLYIGRLSAGTEVSHSVDPARGIWIQVARGTVNVNGQKLEQGDGAALAAVADVAIEATSNTEILLFDLPVSG